VRQKAATLNFKTQLKTLAGTSPLGRMRLIFFYSELWFWNLNLVHILQTHKMNHASDLRWTPGTGSSKP